MIFKPAQLGKNGLTEAELTNDRKKCRKCGPCGIGEKALYLNSFYIDRRYYIPYESVSRVYKRVAMSKGGFSGKGLFASIPYLVVEYDGEKEKQCNFKYEEEVDRMLSLIAERRPEIRLLSEAAEQRLLEKEKERASRYLPELSKEAEEEIERLERAAGYLNRNPELSLELSQSARRKRSYEKSSPSYKWVALAISLLGFVSLVYGIYSLTRHAEFAMYFTLFGMAAIFLFSSASMFPTSRNNKRAIMRRAEEALRKMEAYIESYAERCGQSDTKSAAKSNAKSNTGNCGGGAYAFPLPARYAHPIVLKRMVEAIREGRAANAESALDVVKEDLKSLNSEVEVDQEEYDEVIAIKAMFLNEDYR